MSGITGPWRVVVLIGGCTECPGREDPVRVPMGLDLAQAKARWDKWYREVYCKGLHTSKIDCIHFREWLILKEGCEDMAVEEFRH